MNSREDRELIHLVFIQKEPQPLKYVGKTLIHGKGIHVECSTIQNPNTWSEEEDHIEPKEQKSDWDDWREQDNARRYREWKSDNRSAY